MVDHNILLRNMSANMDIRGSFLEKGELILKLLGSVCGDESGLAHLTTETSTDKGMVHQGSNLGPTLFLLFIFNNVPSSATIAKLLLLADDTSLSLSVSSSIYLLLPVPTFYINFALYVLETIHFYHLQLQNILYKIKYKMLYCRKHILWSRQIRTNLCPNPII